MERIESDILLDLQASLNNLEDLGDNKFRINGFKYSLEVKTNYHDGIIDVEYFNVLDPDKFPVQIENPSIILDWIWNNLISTYKIT